jgi:hypothetical protein
MQNFITIGSVVYERIEDKQTKKKKNNKKKKKKKKKTYEDEAFMDLGLPDRIFTQNPKKNSRNINQTKRKYFFKKSMFKVLIKKEKEPKIRMLSDGIRPENLKNNRTQVKFKNP